MQSTNSEYGLPYLASRHFLSLSQYQCFKNVALVSILTFEWQCMSHHKFVSDLYTDLL